MLAARRPLPIVSEPASEVCISSTSLAFDGSYGGSSGTRRQNLQPRRSEPTLPLRGSILNANDVLRCILGLLGHTAPPGRRHMPGNGYHGVASQLLLRWDCVQCDNAIDTGAIQ